jgi:hypothetical protein
MVSRGRAYVFKWAHGGEEWAELLGDAALKRPLQAESPLHQISHRGGRQHVFEHAAITQ